jgi:hypothetical protein
LGCARGSGELNVDAVLRLRPGRDDGHRNEDIRADSECAFLHNSLGFSQPITSLTYLSTKKDLKLFQKTLKYIYLNSWGVRLFRSGSDGGFTAAFVELD